MKSVKWGEFNVEELFELRKISNMLSKEDLSDDYNFPAYSSDSTNNGIIGYTNNPEFICDEKTPVFITFGDHTRTINIAKESFSVLDNVKVLKPFTSNENYLLFIISSWKKQIPNLGYARHWKVARECKIKLPITEKKEIDFGFMESVIRELEEERIRELNAYLLATNLKEYALSSEEENALKEFESLDNWEEYAFKNIFNNIKQGRRLKKEDQKNGNIPFVMSGTTNTGVVGYISNPVASFPSNSITVDIFGNTFYRNYAFGAGDDTGVYWNDKEKYSKDEMLFFTTSMGKSLFGKFDYGNKLRSSQSFDITMKLPTKNDAPDYSFMETFIKAVEKLVIKNVVLYADEKIEATKEVVSHKSTEYTYDDNSGLLNVAQPPR